MEEVRSPDAAWAELDADAGPDRACGLGDRVFPAALTCPAHHQEISVPGREPDARAAAARSQQQGAGSSDRHDRDHRVVGGAAPDRVAVPGDAVAAVAIEAQ